MYLTRSIWKMLDPFGTASRLTLIHQRSLAVLSRAACAWMSTTSTTTTTTSDRGDRYGSMEWAGPIISVHVGCLFACIVCRSWQVSVRLAEFRELAKEVVRSACRTALLEAGFTPDDYFYEGMDSSTLGRPTLVLPARGVARNFILQGGINFN